MISIRTSKDEVSPHLRGLLRMAARNGPLTRVLGRAAANELKKHFRGRNKDGNKLGGKRTNFWSAVASSVQSPDHSSGKIVVAISHPAIAQKYYGGMITPTKAKNLAIPIAAAAHGKSPRVFSNLRLGITGGGVMLLGRKSGGVMEWLYVLKKSVSQLPDPDALPQKSKMEAALERAGNIALRDKV